MSERPTTVAAGTQVTPSVRLVRPLRSGGMGAVWLADHAALNTRVVVKFMLGGLDSSGSARARFKREAEAASQVKSPHVVQTFDYGVTTDGVPFIVMEYLEGRDLGEEIAAKGALDPARVVAIVGHVAKALSKAHAANLLHRDIKPDNIFLCHQDEGDELFVKLLDFGIAKAPSPDGQEITLDGQTKTGQVVGTPFYMSPEQVTAAKVVDLRSNLWALGVVAFEALTGVRPFDGPSFGALAVKIATGEAPRPSEVNAALPPSVDDWFARACARDPAKRFGSARELADAFRAVFDGLVSLPPTVSGVSDSGPRSRPTDATVPSAQQRTVTSGFQAVRVVSTPRPSVGPGPISVEQDSDAGPSFVLASTVAGDRSALARSEGGAAVAIGDAAAIGGDEVAPGRRQLRLVALIVALVAAAVAIGIGIGETDAPGPTLGTGGASPAGPAPSALPPRDAASASTASAVATAGAASEQSGSPGRLSASERPVVPPPSARPVEEAGAVPVLVAAPTVGVRPRPVASASAAPGVNPSATPSARPTPSATGGHNDPLY